MPEAGRVTQDRQKWRRSIRDICKIAIHFDNFHCKIPRQQRFIITFQHNTNHANVMCLMYNGTTYNGFVRSEVRLQISTLHCDEGTLVAHCITGQNTYSPILILIFVHQE